MKKLGNGEKLNGFEIGMTVTTLVGAVASIVGMILGVKNPRGTNQEKK